MRKRILVAEDEPQMGRLLQAGLSARGYEVTIATDGQQVLELVMNWQPDVLLLDLGLPLVDGLEVCRQVRSWSQLPIIVLTVRDTEDEKVAALDLGADDYLTKPFSMKELLARIRVTLRHAARTLELEEPTLRFGELQIDRAHRVVAVRDQKIHLTPTEYDLLCVLATHIGKVLTHRMLLRAVWGAAYEQDVPTLRVFITQLRHKIEPDPAHPIYIRTEPAIGYRFDPDG
jgi:two-component system, OmpR family, KDP operon response regulator KdpE